MATTYTNAQVAANGTITTYSTLYKTPTSGTSAVISTLAIVNTASTSATYRIGIMTTEGTPSGANWLVYDASVGGNDCITITSGISLPAGASANNIIRISSSANTVNFHAFISEIT